MAESVFIPVLLGTARTNRNSEKAAKFVHAELAKQDGVETQLVDVASMGYSQTVPPWGEGGADEHPTEWKEIMTRADGLIIVTPEYNHGYPGELKMALDSLYDEYEKKPVGICGVSKGHFGGARVVDHIKQVLIEFKMVPARNAMYFSKIKEAFDEDGNPTDEKLAERLNKVFEEVLWYARALKPARENTA